MGELLGENLLRKKGEDPESTADLLKNKDFVMLYFSAHWCPPCRAYTPQLSKAFKDYIEKDGKENRVAIVFVSSDQDQAAFDGYFEEMSFYALPFSEREKKTNLGSKYEVKGIPSLVLLNGKGETVQQNIRGQHGKYLK